MLRLAGALEQGNLVEVTIETESGAVKAMAEILEPTRKSKDGILQPFRFIALEDNDHLTLRNALDTRVDKDFLGLSFPAVGRAEEKVNFFSFLLAPLARWRRSLESICFGGLNVAGPFSS